MLKRSIGDIETKRKFEEEPPTLAHEENSSNQQLQSLKPVDPSKNQVQEDKALSCRFCTKKFRNSQGLGGHQNAHKRERLLLNIEKEQKMNAYGFGSNNVPLYDPYSLSSISNSTLQGIPFYRGAHIMNPMAHHIPNNKGFYLPPQNLGLTSSLGGGVAPSQWRLNHEAVWQQIHSLAESASQNRVSGSSSRIGVGFGGSENPSGSTKDSSSEDLDLTLKL